MCDNLLFFTKLTWKTCKKNLGMSKIIFLSKCFYRILYELFEPSNYSVIKIL